MRKRLVSCSDIGEHPVDFKVAKVIKPTALLLKLYPHLFNEHNSYLVILSFKGSNFFLKQEPVLEIHSQLQNYLLLSEELSHIFQPLLSIDVIYNRKSESGFRFETLLKFEQNQQAWFAGDLCQSDNFLFNWEKKKSIFIWILKNVHELLDQLHQFFQKQKSKYQGLLEYSYDFCIIRKNNEFIVKLIPSYGYSLQKSEHQKDDLKGLHIRSLINKLLSFFFKNKSSKNFSKFEKFLETLKVNNFTPTISNQEISDILNNHNQHQIIYNEEKARLIIHNHYQLFLTHSSQYIGYIFDKIPDFHCRKFIKWIPFRANKSPNYNPKNFEKKKQLQIAFLEMFINKFEFMTANSTIMFSKVYQLFLFPEKSKFYNYSHFEMRLKKIHNIKQRYFKRDIPLEHEKIKIMEKGILLNLPIRGKYCSHFAFSNAIKVYLQIISNQEVGYECQFCQEWVDFQDIIYLEQIHIIIECLKRNHLQKYLSSYDHLDEADCFLHINTLTKQVWIQLLIPTFQEIIITFVDAYKTLINPNLCFKKLPTKITELYSIFLEMRNQQKERLNIFEEATQKVNINDFDD